MPASFPAGALPLWHFPVNCLGGHMTVVLAHCKVYTS
jgi:hypothetical protein